MRPGPLPPLKRKLNPTLRDAIREAMRHHSSGTLALCAGWIQPSTFSTELHARRVKVTPTNVERFTKVAAIVGFTGPLFLEEEEQR